MADKSKSSSSKVFVKGGSTKMFGKQTAGTQTPGQTAQVGKNGGGKVAKGGSTKMFGKQQASPKKPGQTGK